MTGACSQSPDFLASSPHFSPVLCCSAGYIRHYCVALGRAPRRTVKYACGALPARALSWRPLRRFATTTGEKGGLRVWLSRHDFRATRPGACTDPGFWHGPRPFKSGFPVCSMGVSVTDSNRRVRTRTHGGVAGVGGRPPPLRRSRRSRGVQSKKMIGSSKDNRFEFVSHTGYTG